MPLFHCTGWWEQAGYGRQPMIDLQLTFDNERIAGSGVDIVGRFELDGMLKEDQICLRKRYIEQHEIEYHGVSIGEGAYAGQWSCDGYPGGNWFIGIQRFVETTNAVAVDVQEFDAS